MNVVDIIILIALALGAVAGFKAGVIKKISDFIGTESKHRETLQTRSGTPQDLLL